MSVSNPGLSSNYPVSIYLVSTNISHGDLTVFAIEENLRLEFRFGVKSIFQSTQLLLRRLVTVKKLTATTFCHNLRKQSKILHLFTFILCLKFIYFAYYLIGCFQLLILLVIYFQSFIQLCMYFSLFILYCIF